MQQRYDAKTLHGLDAPVRRRETAIPRAQTDYDDGLLRAALPIMIAAYGFMFLVATITFWQSTETLLSVGVCVIYAAMFFGVQLVMASLRNSHDARWLRDAPEASGDRVSIFGGSIRRGEAILHIVLVPLVMAGAFTVLSMAWIASRP